MKEFTEENILSLPPMCDSPAGDNSVLMKGMKTTQALAHTWVVRKDLQNEEP